MVVQKFGDFDEAGTIRLQEGALTRNQMDDDIAAKSWIDVSVLNLADPDVNCGEQTNGILYDHDDTKSLGLLDTKGVEEHV